MVVGGGYAGQLAANLAARRTSGRVTLVNERDRFVERVRLHQVAAGQRVREHALADLLRGTGARLVVDRVTRIDPRTRTVELAAGEPLRYDTLIYAAGSRADLASVPGAAEHAFGLADVEQTVRLRERLARGGTVSVVGGGLTGVEAATEIAESHPRVAVRLLTDGVLGAGLSARGRRHLARVCARLGVEVREGARVVEVLPDGVALAGGAHLAADTVVWATGFTVPRLAAESGLAVDEHGRLLVDDTLRSVSHPDVYGVGDAAAVRRSNGQELRMACATGLPTGQWAVRVIGARQAGRAATPLRFRYINQCVSLGRRDGLIQFVRADDSPREAVLTGRLAALYKELVVRGALLAQRHPWLPTAPRG
ncbi:oxidoreductase [Actinophytocola xanthii]|uniref:Oxidoreductase n=1 Tax=Actinophytocola xanthii TaxID=1912961 RepID=A0A1Q8CZ54_9PSEU|nr:oxidoreductase [Actinophytocola xanthii]